MTSSWLVKSAATGVQTWRNTSLGNHWFTPFQVLWNCLQVCSILGLWPVNSPHKGSVTRKMFPFYDVIISIMFLVTMIDENCDNYVFSCDRAALRTPLSVCLSVRLSHLFHYVPVIVSSRNLQELLTMTEVMSMQKVKVKGQGHKGHNPT